MRDAEDLGDMFAEESQSSARMFALVNDPDVYQVLVNRFDRVFYSDSTGRHYMQDVFHSPEDCFSWLENLLSYTDTPPSVLNSSEGPFEAVFSPRKTSIRGTVHVVPSVITRDEPAVTIRIDSYRPEKDLTLDALVDRGVLNETMRDLLEQAVRGRTNILVSGPSGSGKTTLARALAWYIEPSHRIVTVEDVEELHLSNKLPNVVSMTAHRVKDESGSTVEEHTLYDLTTEALRMRPDRIWVGEVRGREAYAMVKACNSGHDGACATIHADNPSQALRQLITYTMEAGVSETVARSQVARAVNLVVQTALISGRRLVTHITEVEPIREGEEQRENNIFLYDFETARHLRRGHPSPSMLRSWARYGVAYDSGPFTI